MSSTKRSKFLDSQSSNDRSLKRAVLFVLVPVVAVLLFLIFNRAPEAVRANSQHKPVVATQSPSFTASQHQPLTREKRVTQFIQWMKEHGTVFPKNISLTSIQGMGLGLLNLGGEIKEDEVYLKIPYNRLVIGRQFIFHDRQVNQTFAEITRLYGDNIKYQIILYLLYQKFVQRDKSYWKPYLDMLPEKFSVPLYWNKDDLEYLRGSTIFEDVQRDLFSLQQEYNGIKHNIFQKFPLSFPPNEIQLEDWKYMSSVYNSRLFFIEGKNPREHLVPLAEMVNCEENMHGPSARKNHEFVEMDETQQYAILKADRDFKHMEQIFESYGKKSNNELLRYEGFIVEDESKLANDCVFIQFQHNRHNDYQSQIQHILGFRGYPRYCVSSKKVQEGMWPISDPSSALYLSFFYLKELGERVETIEELKGKAQQMVFTKANGMSYMWRTLRTMCEQHIQGIEANPLVSEQTLLTPISEEAKLAIRFQLLDKKLLKRTVDLLASRTSH